MKPLLSAASLLLALVPVVAQTSSTTTSSSTTTTTAPSAPPASGEGGMSNYAGAVQQAMATLTPDEKTEVTSAREKAMAANPALQTEEMDLMQKVMALQSGEADVDRQALGVEMRAHAQKVRAAMIQADPAVQAIIVKIEAQVAKLRAEAQAGH